MKKLILFVLMLSMSLSFAVAANAPAKKEIKTTVFTTDINCHKCANKIMNNVPVFGKGIKDVRVNVEKKEVTLVYDASKNNDQHLIEAFKSLKIVAKVKGDNAPVKK